MTEKQKNRLKIQKECELLFDNNDNVLLELATGVGKSFNAINLQARMEAKITFICVAETAHINNWIDEYKKHGYEELLKNTEIFCYESLRKYKKRSCDLIIFDEAHHIFSEIRLRIIETISSKKKLLLSATISDENKSIARKTFGSFGEIKVSLEDAIEMQILPKPKINIITLELDDKHKTEEIIFQRGNKYHYEKIVCDYIQRKSYIYSKSKYPDIHLTIRCTQKEKYMYIDEEYEKYNYLRQGRPLFKFKWLKIGGERKRYLSDCKTKQLEEIKQKISNKRFICFCGSIEQANQLGGLNSINSKNKNSKLILQNFNEKKINSIFAVNMGVEGLNLIDIEAAVIGQLDGTERPLIQKMGRSLRAEYPIVYILYFKNTKDEDYLRNVLNNIPEEYINYGKN